MELTNKDIQMSKGYAIISMLILHLFCLKGSDIIGEPLLWIDNETPVIYYLGWLCAICAPTYCCCSGYAHYCQGENNGLTIKRNLKRILKFLIVFWTCCIFVCIMGIVLKSNDVPGQFFKFFKNLFLLEWSYTGIWWYAYIYIVYCLFSPIIYKIVKKNGGIFTICVLLIQFIIVESIYKISPEFFTNDVVVNYVWIRIYYLLGARLLGYVGGMLLAKYKVITFIKNKIQKIANGFSVFILLVSLLIMGVGLIIVNRGILIVLFTFPVFLVFNSIKKSRAVESVFLYLGKYSTYIWLIHPFIYGKTFPVIRQFILTFNNPVLILISVLIVCCIISMILNHITMRIIQKIK